MAHDVTITAPLWLLALVAVAAPALVVGAFLWGWRGGWLYAVYERIDLRARLNWERARLAARGVTGRAAVAGAVVAADPTVFDHLVRRPAGRTYPVLLDQQTVPIHWPLNTASAELDPDDVPVPDVDRPVEYDEDEHPYGLRGDDEFAVWLTPGVPMSPWGASMLREFNRRTSTAVHAPRHALPDREQVAV